MAFRHAVLTVGTTAVKLSGTAASSGSGQSLTVIPASGVTLYIGGPTVTVPGGADPGVPITSSASVDLRDSTSEIWGICTVASQTVYVLRDGVV